MTFDHCCACMHAVWCRAVVWCGMMCCIMLCTLMLLWCTVLCRTVLALMCCVVLYVMCCAVLCCAVCTVLCCAGLGWAGLCCVVCSCAIVLCCACCAVQLCYRWTKALFAGRPYGWVDAKHRAQCMVVRNKIDNKNMREHVRKTQALAFNQLAARNPGIDAYIYIYIGWHEEPEDLRKQLNVEWPKTYQGGNIDSMHNVWASV